MFLLVLDGRLTLHCHLNIGTLATKNDGSVLAVHIAIIQGEKLRVICHKSISELSGGKEALQLKNSLLAESYTYRDF